MTGNISFGYVYECFATVTALETEVDETMERIMRIPSDTPPEVRLSALDNAGYSADALKQEVMKLLPVIEQCLNVMDRNDARSVAVMEGLFRKTSQYRILAERVVRMCDYAHRIQNYRIDADALAEVFSECEDGTEEESAEETTEETADVEAAAEPEPSDADDTEEAAEEETVQETNAQDPAEPTEGDTDETDREEEPHADETIDPMLLEQIRSLLQVQASSVELMDKVSELEAQMKILNTQIESMPKPKPAKKRRTLRKIAPKKEGPQ